MKMKLLPLFVILLTEVAYTDNITIGIEIPMGLKNGNAASQSQCKIILPVCLVGKKLDKNEICKTNSGWPEVIKVACMILKSIYEENISVFKNHVSFNEKDTIDNPGNFFKFLKSRYFYEGGEPIILAYSSDAETYCVWVTTSKKPQKLYAMQIRKSDLKWNFITQGGQFGVVQEFLSGDMLASATHDTSKCISVKDPLFNLMNQINLYSTNYDELNPLINNYKENLLANKNLSGVDDENNVYEKRFVRKALDALNNPVAFYTINGITAVIGKNKNDELSLFEFENNGRDLKLIMDQNLSSLGKYILTNHIEWKNNHK